MTRMASRTLPPHTTTATRRQQNSDNGCTHVHAHCCAATAILATATVAPAASGPGQLRLERNGALPYGQLSHPPLRPPRMTA